VQHSGPDLGKEIVSIVQSKRDGEIQEEEEEGDEEKNNWLKFLKYIYFKMTSFQVSVSSGNAMQRRLTAFSERNQSRPSMPPTLPKGMQYT
jgi:hypothetical protein